MMRCSNRNLVFTIEISLASLLCPHNFELPLTNTITTRYLLDISIVFLRLGIACVCVLTVKFIVILQIPVHPY